MSEPTQFYRSLRDPDAYEMRCMMDLLAEGGPGQPPFLVSVEPVEKYYAVPNDLIGGWDVSEYNKPVGDHGEHEFSIGSFMSKECAEQVARAMNLLAGIVGDDE